MIVLLEPERPPGFTSGGYRYQEQVAQRLAAHGLGQRRAVPVADLAAAAAAAGAATDHVVVDGLFGELGVTAPPAGTRVLLHAVPTHASWCRDRDVITTAATTALAVRESARSVHVVRPGVDDDFVPPTTPPPPPGTSARDRWRIVCIGTVGPGKDQGLVARALQPFADRCELVVLGDLSTNPPYVAALRTAATALPMQLRGVVAPTEVARELQRAHLLVSASRNESYGMAVAEAVACGTPVFAFATGEIGALVHDGDNGVLLPTTVDDAGFCAGLAALLATPTTLSAMRQQTPPPRRRWEQVAAEFAAACHAAG